MLYELVNPSDKITFQADNEKVACYCAWTLSSGFWVQNENWITYWIPAFHGWDSLVEEVISKDIPKFIEENKNKIKKCFKSFMYWDFQNFKDFQNCLDAITDKEKKIVFLKKHEDNHRSSLNKIVLRAWELWN